VLDPLKTVVVRAGMAPTTIDKARKPSEAKEMAFSYQFQYLLRFPWLRQHARQVALVQ